MDWKFVDRSESKIKGKNFPKNLTAEWIKKMHVVHERACTWPPDIVCLTHLNRFCFRFCFRLHVRESGVAQFFMALRDLEIFKTFVWTAWSVDPWWHYLLWTTRYLANEKRVVDLEPRLTATYYRGSDGHLGHLF